jgi:post-segregation antitoxin (ccd killing protein)
MSKRPRRPNGSAGARTTISLPVSLVARLRRITPAVNVSAVCTRALTTEVEMREQEVAWEEFVAFATGVR